MKKEEKNSRATGLKDALLETSTAEGSLQFERTFGTGSFFHHQIVHLYSRAK